MFCTNCGNSIKEENKFCTNCGQKTNYTLNVPNFATVTLNLLPKLCPPHIKVNIYIDGNKIATLSPNNSVTFTTTFGEHTLSFDFYAFNALQNWSCLTSYKIHINQKQPVFLANIFLFISYINGRKIYMKQIKEKEGGNLYE